MNISSIFCTNWSEAYGQKKCDHFSYTYHRNILFVCVYRAIMYCYFIRRMYTLNINITF